MKWLEPLTLRIELFTKGCVRTSNSEWVEFIKYAWNDSNPQYQELDD